MPEFLSRCVGPCLGSGDSARKQSVAGWAEGRDWFEEATSARQDHAACCLIVIPASLLRVATQRRRYDHMPLVHPHRPAFLSQPHTRGAGIRFAAPGLKVTPEDRLVDDPVNLALRRSAYSSEVSRRLHWIRSGDSRLFVGVGIGTAIAATRSSGDAGDSAPSRRPPRRRTRSSIPVSASTPSPRSSH